MRVLGRMLLGLIVLGVILGFVLRNRWPRHQLPWLLAAAFAPALLHLAFIAFRSGAEGVAPRWVGLYVAVTAATAAAAWWQARRLADVRSASAALLVPAQALLQWVATGVLERAVIALGAAPDPIATVAFVGVAIMVGTALLVALPSRAHLPAGPRAPAWWVALMRTLGRR
jgi:hypothetical protein